MALSYSGRSLRTLLPANASHPFLMSELSDRCETVPRSRIKGRYHRRFNNGCGRDVLKPCPGQQSHGNQVLLGFGIVLEQIDEIGGRCRSSDTDNLQVRCVAGGELPGK